MDLTSGQQIADVNTVGLSSVGGMIVAGDGDAYVPYASTSTTYNGSTLDACPEYGTCVVQSTGDSYVLQITPDGGSTKFDLQENWTYTQTCTVNQDGSGECTRSGSGNDFSIPALVTNVDNGVAAFAIGRAPNYCANSSWPSDADGGPAAGTSTNCVNPPINFQMVAVSADGEITAQNNSVYTVPQPSDGDLRPVLQRADGSFIVGHDGTLLAITPGGQVLWQQLLAPDLGGVYIHPLYAQADGSVVATTTAPKCSPGDLQFVPAVLCPSGLAPNQQGYGQMGTLYTLDQNGAVTSQMPDAGAGISWTGEWYEDPPSSVSDVAPPFPLQFDDASFSAAQGANLSATGAAVPLCPCLLQTVGSDQLTSSGSGKQTTDLLLVGDPGKNGGLGHMWNVGNLFNLAAQTAGAELTSNGDTVAIDRVTYVSKGSPSVANALTSNGLITGNIIYFGHGGAANVDGTDYSALFVGQDPIFDENLTALNVSELPVTMLGTNVKITLNACEGAWNGKNSIAQAIANQLRRKVFAYPTGMFFSTNPKATAPTDTKFQNQIPIYMRASGAESHPRSSIRSSFAVPYFRYAEDGDA